MKLNLMVRIKNRTFWITLIPALLVLVQSIAESFGYKLDLGDIGNNMINVVNSAFVVLTIIGVVNDPTTSGISDSTQAMEYQLPKKED